MNAPISITHEEFLLFQDYLEEQYGIRLEKEKEYLITARLTPVLRELEMTAFHQLYLLLKQNPPVHLTNRIKELITTNESLWFRDNHPFAIVKEIILPQLIDSRPLSPIRFLSAGSAKGQEAYSIAITMEEFCRSNPNIDKDRFEITAIDLNPSMVEEAALGCFGSFDIERGMPKDILERYFSHSGDGWIIDESLRKRVSFHSHNLMNPLNMYGKFDAIFYRNVMIYFSGQHKTQSFQHVLNCLRSSGFLLLGSMERLPEGEWSLEKKRYEKGIFYQKEK